MAPGAREALRVPAFHGYDASEVGARRGGEGEGSAIRRLTMVGAVGYIIYTDVGRGLKRWSGRTRW